jgi:hypothetical protein
VNKDSAGTEIILENVTELTIETNETIVLYTNEELDVEIEDGLILEPVVETEDPVDTEEPTEEPEEEDPVDVIEEEPEEELNFFQRFWNWLRSLFS